MTLIMPAPESEILARRDELIERLRAILPAPNLIVDETARRAYECDAFTMYRALPLVVALPETVAQVSAIMALAAEMNVKIVPRGAGTSLSGGSMPLVDGILLGMSKFNRVLEIDYENRCARVQPGVQNLGDLQSGRGQGLLLRARSLLADRLLHRRQCRARTPAACIASNTVSRPTTSLGSKSCSWAARWCGSAASISTARLTIFWD